MSLPGRAETVSRATSRWWNARAIVSNIKRIRTDANAPVPHGSSCETITADDVSLRLLFSTFHRFHALLRGGIQYMRVHTEPITTSTKLTNICRSSAARLSSGFFRFLLRKGGGIICLDVELLQNTRTSFFFHTTRLHLISLSNLFFCLKLNG